MNKQWNKLKETIIELIDNDGTAIDIYRDNMDRAWEWVGQWGDHVYVRWLKGEG